MSGRYWILTIPQHEYVPYLPAELQFVRGQLELAASGFLHWQLVAAWPKTVRLSAVKKLFGPFHAELTKSERALEYVWKDDTAVDGTRFQLGEPATKRNDKRDWQAIWDSARSGDIESIEVAARVQHYRTIKQISVDYLAPIAVARSVHVFWGATGSGKSHRAWGEAGLEAYPKDSKSKFWCGYRGQQHVVMDEFRGGIDIAHILKWFDKYPVIVETKGGATVLAATTFWVTSNIDPRLWYPDLDIETQAALLRRLNVTHFNEPFIQE